MNEGQLRGERLPTEDEVKKTGGRATGDLQEMREGPLPDAGRREEAAGEVREVLSGEPPGAEDDADGIL